jgi:dihydrolipoamide dehydrogenase
MHDVVVIGGGPGGYVAAIRAAQNGLRTALVEMDRVGGTCLNRGCIPTKAMVKSAELYQEMLHAAEFGLRATDLAVDMPAVIARKDRIVETLTGGVAGLLRANAVDLIAGKASIPAPGSVTVELTGGGVQDLVTRNIIIATGSRTQMPPVPEDQWAHTIDSTDALSMQHIPRELLVIGGGVLGIEFACIYNAFGSRVTCVKRTPGIIPEADPELAQRLAILLKRRGININTGIYIKRIEGLPGGRKALVAEERKGDQSQEVRFEADEILVAMGRIPNFGGIDLDALGIEWTPKGIRTDERMQTNVRGIYAIGDVCGRYYLAFVASAEGMVAADAIAGRDAKIDYRIVPQCVFSMPEIASVGITEKEAKDAGREVKISKFPFSANGRALALGETDGLVKVIADQGGAVIGVHVLGPRATDLVLQAGQLMALGAKAHDIADPLLHGHPTLSEAFMEAAHGIDSQPIHLATRRR